MSLRGRFFLVATMLAVAVLSQREPAGARTSPAEEALRTGRYEAAIEGYREQLDENPGDVHVYRGLARALRETGRYEEAEQLARRFERAFPDSSALSNLLGELLVESGRLPEARAAFERAVAGRASDRLTARLNLAVLDYRQGRREQAMAGFDRFIDIYNSSRGLSWSDLVAVGVACRYLGVDNPQLFRDALRALDEAVQVDPRRLEPKIEIGELFLEKYNSTDAGKTFREVLDINPQHPRALVGMAKVMDFDGAAAKAIELVRRALETNPNLAAAHVFLAEHQLSLEDYGLAAETARRALEVNPASLEALSVLAAAEFLAGNDASFEEVERQVLDLSPQYAELYNTLAEVCVQNRLYREAVVFASKALDLDRKSWRAYGLLGLNQLRLGEMDEGRENLERSFAGDPYDVWIKNTLDLLDTFVNYEETQSERFLVVADEKESSLLAPYVIDLAEEAYDALAARYSYRPPTPIRIEVYPSHADFSVRTIGLAGLGALGVCFGPVVAIDSPSARARGDFSWGSTLWHELAHTITLGMTDHRVPRWFSEGLSVFEERRARPGWGDDVKIPFLLAMKRDELLPIRELNNGFVRPKTPHQVGISYFQASLVCELVARDHGFEAILEMLGHYKQGLRDEEVFRTVLGMELEQFDDVFDAYLEERFADPVRALKIEADDEPRLAVSRGAIEARALKDPGDFGAQLAMGEALFEEGKLEEAKPYLERARDLFPSYGGEDSPLWYLAQIHRMEGEAAEADEVLSRFTSLNESHYDAHVTAADVKESLGKTGEAVEVLERAIYIYPFDIELHRRLAKLHRSLGDWESSVREREAVVALERVDRAQAIFELAQAHYGAGNHLEARRTVLRALEVAPNFGPAQQLLLEILDKSDGGTND